MPAIVADPHRVTAAWLTEILHHRDYQAEVAAFTWQNIGTGQVGQNARFSLTYAPGKDTDKDKGPETLVGKFASVDPTSRATGSAQNNYLKEVRFYQQLRSTLDIRTPEVLFTDIDIATDDFCLMMEDLAPAVQGDQLAGCSVEEAALALHEAAGLHAPRWADASLEALEWLGRQTAETAAAGQALYDQVFPGFINRYERRLSPQHMQVARRLGEGFTAWASGYGGPQTVTHGDYRLDNMLFGGPYPLTVVDWQTPGIGAALADVSYFLGAGLLPETRRASERELVRAYHEELCGRGVSDYPFSDCWEDYRRFSFSGLLMAVVASMIVGQTDRGDDMFMAMASRHAQQVLDLDALEFLDA